MAKNWTLPRRPDGTVDTDGTGGFVQLPPENFVPAKMPMQVTHPRPDGEAAATARHRHLYPNLPYRIPICVQGGAAPFGFSFGGNHDLPGSSIGAFLTASGDKYVVGDDYGVLHGTAPASGTYTVEINVRDQGGAVVPVTWQVTVSADNFIVADFNGTGNNLGTVGDPFLDTESVWGPDNAGSINAGKIVMFRGGTHTMTRPNGGNALRLDPTLKAHSVINYGNESVTIDMATGGNGDGSNGMTFVFVTGCDDVYFGGCEFDGNSDTPAGPGSFYQFVAFQNPLNRLTWFDCTFSNFTKGAGGDDGANPGTFYLMNAAKQHINLSRITYGGTSGGCLTMYDCNNSVNEHILIEGIADWSGVLSNTGRLIFHKDRADYVSVRFCDVGRNCTNLGNVSTGICFNNQGGGNTYNEISYCKTGDDLAYSVLIAGHIEIDPMFIYRCNLGGWLARADPLAGDSILVEKTYVDNPGGNTITGVDDNGDNVTTDNTLDDDLNLIDRATDLGKKGAEVAG